MTFRLSPEPEITPVPKSKSGVGNLSYPPSSSRTTVVDETGIENGKEGGVGDGDVKRESLGGTDSKERGLGGTGMREEGEGGIEGKEQGAVEGQVEAISKILVDPADDIKPDGGYGWVVAFCLMGVNSVTWGINTVYGVYTSYYIQHNYFSGGSTFRYAWVGGLSVAVALSCGPLANALSRKYGFRTPMMLGALCTVLGQCMAGICHSFATFMVCQGVVFGLGLGMTLVPGQPLLAHWFDRRLSFAQGVANCGSGLGALILCNTTRLALASLGVKWSLIINGLISLVVLVPCVTLLRDRHAAVGARSAPLQLGWMIHPGFVWVILWGCLVMLSYFIALYSLASFATDGLRLSQTQGAALQSILAAGQMLGRPIWGLALDRGGRINMVSLAYLISGLSCLAIWLPARSFGVLVFFALVQGLVGGTIWSSATPMSARVVGVQDLSSALGIFWLVCVPPALVAQPIAILLMEYSSNQLGRQGVDKYFISIGFCGGVSAAAGLALLGAKRWLQGDWKIWKIT
ncbi:major facilitator superfamily domain-containing protein [Naematelia encephala]|uniref:Major facilitator superfamily domain-containing protein n=1 Tax=Naematelia encephala TaxID=71784 RepID=A0A1Y2B009_9TREE|nr:major facilitator superfamily domain-containing protein [Naematelia encephala]